MGWETVALQLAPSIISALGNMATTWIGGQVGNTSSATSNTSNASMSQSGTTQTSQTGSQTGSVSGTTTQTGSNTQTGSISGLANALSTALGTATGNNSQTAASFNQGSAQTANDLQQKLWTYGNIMSMGSNLLNNAMSAASTTSAKQYNSAEAEKERAWQKEMSSTTYQRGVEDMKAAGLNPVLAAYNGYGAGSAPSGGYGSVSGGQTFQQANIASSPSMHTATMQAMYDYGNNTSQFLNNAMATINNAKQTGEYSMASTMEQVSQQVMSSSAKTVANLSQQMSSSGSSNQTGSSSSHRTFGGSSGGSSSGGHSSGGGAGRGR